MKHVYRHSKRWEFLWSKGQKCALSFHYSHLRTSAWFHNIPASSTWTPLCLYTGSSTPSMFISTLWPSQHSLQVRHRLKVQYGLGLDLLTLSSPSHLTPPTRSSSPSTLTNSAPSASQGFLTLQTPSCWVLCQYQQGYNLIYFISNLSFKAQILPSKASFHKDFKHVPVFIWCLSVRRKITHYFVHQPCYIP